MGQCSGLLKVHKEIKKGMEIDFPIRVKELTQHTLKKKSILILLYFLSKVDSLKWRTQKGVLYVGAKPKANESHLPLRGWIQKDAYVKKKSRFYLKIKNLKKFINSIIIGPFLARVPKESN